MKVAFRRILSMEADGAVCSMLTLDGKINIMLDCGINRCFDFSRYRQIQEELIKVDLALISHSSVEYSGAFPFLVSELMMNPQIFYTTQPVMRYCPLNIHQEILNLRLPSYNEKLFNKIYACFEAIQLIKPNQKTEIILGTSKTRTQHGKQQQHSQKEKDALKPQDVQKPQDTQKPQDAKKEQNAVSQQKQFGEKVQICCYLAGGSLCSLYWRINYGLINILYLIQYNVYPLNHIKGLNTDNINAQSTHLLITDTYPRNIKITADKLYEQILQAVIAFYKSNDLNPKKNNAFVRGQDRALLFVCYPNQLIVQTLCILHKVVTELQEEGSAQKIGAIHISKRFLQLIKSQSEYFFPDFRLKLQKNQTHFHQSTKIENRISVCSVGFFEGVLSSQSNVQIYRIGSQVRRENLERIEEVSDKLQDMSIFREEMHNVLQRLWNLNIVDQVRQPHPMEQNHENPQQLQTKQERIQVVNILFEFPIQQPNHSTCVQPLNLSSMSFHKTDFISSIFLIRLIQPRDIIFVNLPQQSKEIVAKYQEKLPRFSWRPNITVFDSSVHQICQLSYRNDLLQYKLSYQPLIKNKQIQRVKGIIEKTQNNVHIHLNAVADTTDDFQLQQFYSKMIQKYRCSFIGNGILFEGIHIYVSDRSIILEGEYSQQLFVVRKQLYHFVNRQ